MLTFSIDTRAAEKTLEEYMKYTSRSLEEANIQHAYYFARDATFTTHAADKEVIRSKLSESSDVYPNVPLGAIIVNTRLSKAGKKGLSGPKMVAAMEKLIKVRQGHTNFLRSGWLNSIKYLATLVPKKGGSRIPSGVNKKGRDSSKYGGAKVIKSMWNPITLVWNTTSTSSTTLEYVQEGAEKALAKMVEGMKQYILKKQALAKHKFWS